jgi:hypothetical protein
MGGDTVDFVLTRFEAVDGARLEVEGRWTGVRGMRFVRPALVVHEGGGERTLLAVLEHKPWPAEEGEPWVAAFPWEGGDVDPAQAELAVAPSIVVPLAEPDPDAVEDPNVALRRRLADAEERTRRLEAEVGFLRREREERPAPEAIEREHAAVESARSAALTERDAAVASRQVAMAERDEARAERERAEAERDAALAERDALREQLRDRERAAEGAAGRREQALAERDAARRERQRAEQRAAEIEHAVEELDAARGELQEARAQRDEALAQPAGVVSRGAPGRRRDHEDASTRADWAARTAAILAILVLLVLAITFLRAI